MAEQAEGSCFRPARVSFDVLIKKALASCIFGVCATLISSVCVGVCACAHECVGISMCTLSYFLIIGKIALLAVYFFSHTLGFIF